MTGTVTKTVEDRATAQALMETMLVGAGFHRFSFDTAFSLRFIRPTRPTFHGHAVPQALELRLDGPWRLGDAATWAQTVARLADPAAVEPEEAVKAYALASLRWQAGTEVEAVRLGAEETVIRFSGGQALVIAATRGESAWVLQCPLETDIDRTFSVASEGGEPFACFPDEGAAGDA